MLFNTISYGIFLPVIFILYWTIGIRFRKIQNPLLLVASYFFYACWDWRFLFLLMFSTLLDYFTALKMVDASTLFRKKFWFWLSIIVNLGFLGVFKYFNFFTLSFSRLLDAFGFEVHPWTLSVILPVGISFYTFHGLSYVIDVYYDRIKPERNFVDYSLFVSFFPLLVAGPIERATHLLPQIKSERAFDFEKAKNGLRQILWGLFKKVVIADQCAEFANIAFNNSEHHTGSTLALGALFFTFQIYGDFSGYSDIALGTAKLFGVDLLRNFAYPYFSRDIAEFWRRWHISLSSWFRDYLYIPLGGSKGSTWVQVRNVFIIFIVSGFWHGASFTFIIWGFLNALFILPSVLYKTNRNNLDIVAKGKALPSLHELFYMVVTFLLTNFAWIFFRSNSVQDAVHFILGITGPSFFTSPDFAGKSLSVIGLLLVFFMVVEWIGREKQFAIEEFGTRSPRLMRWSFYYALGFLIFYFSGAEQQFIYFQF